MKFAHISDVHIGGWREPKLTELGILSFERAIETCIKENTAFLLIAGDLFNTSMPSIDLIKRTAAILKKLKNKGISCYIIPGSHDFSPSGKTMLDVLEKSGLCVNVVKLQREKEKIKLDFTVDKTNVKITGLYGKKGSLEKNEYMLLDKKNLEEEDGFKIFMFHTALTEFKPEYLEKIESQPIAILPKNFNYYAGGHVHYIFEGKKDSGTLVFPGPLLPNNFSELEKLKNGGFYLVEVKDKDLKLKYVPIKLKEVISIKIDANNKTPAIVEKEILNFIKKHDIKDKIITLHVSGILAEGRPSDINFKEILSKLNDAYVVLRNTANLHSKEFEELKIETGSTDEIENKIIDKFLKTVPIKIGKDEELIYDLIRILDKEKIEDEKVTDFETRVIKDANKILNLG